MKQRNFRKSNAGFTLVELIVVIAIMAILAGVGTVGYSAYIKHANKGNDKTLVGNTIRAVETGVYSGSYTANQMLQPSENGVQIPIGFVVLTENGTTVLENSSEVVSVEKTGCVRKTVNVCQIVNASRVTSSVKALYEEEIEYCETHSNIPSDLNNCTTLTGKQIKEKVGISENASMYKANYIGGAYTASLKKVDNNKSYLMKGTYRLVKYTDEHVSKAETAEVSAYQVVNPVPNNEESDLYKMLVNAMGSDFTNQKLSYKWSDSALSTFYANGQSLWNKVESLGEQICSLPVNSNGEIANTNIISKKYESTDELTKALSETYVAKFGTKNGETLSANDAAENFYQLAWKSVDESKADSDTWHSAGFNLDDKGREFFCAARVAYNEAFASYLQTNFDDYGNHDATHVQNVRDYGADILGEKVGLNLGYILPKTVCRSAFTNTTNQLNANCEQCKAIYEDYVKDGTSHLNALQFYKIMVTIAETQEASNNSPYGVMGYYQNYIEQLEALYAGVTNITKDAESVVVIAFYYDGVTLTSEVLPSEANPRE